MVWNASRPADSDRIRLSASLLRDNFAAIQLGNVPYTTLTLTSQGSLPASPGQVRLYGFGSAESGQTEFTAINGAGAPVILTTGGKVGAATQEAIFSKVTTAQTFTGSITFDNSFTYTSGLMITCRATCSSGGTVTMNDNMTVTRTGVGRYTLQVPAGILTGNSYQVFLQPKYNNATDSVFIDVVSKPNINPAAQTNIPIEVIYRADGSKVDSGFDVMIIGGR